MNDLLIYQTKLANQRTFLAYLRNGIAISSIAGVFKKKWICIFGILMIIISAIQYITVNNSLTKNKNVNDPMIKSFDMIPLLYVFMLFALTYIEFNN